MAAMSDGFDELDAALAKLPDMLQVELLGLAVAAGAEVLRDGAERRAPRLTGDLAEGMTYQLTAHRDGVTASIGPDKDSFYGLFQEFGTSHQPARPFLRPTVDEDGARAVSAIAQKLKEGLERKARQLGQGAPKAA